MRYTRVGAVGAAAAAALLLAGCGAPHPARSTHRPTPTVAPTPSTSDRTTVVPATASGSGLSIAAGRPTRFGADSSAGVSGIFTLLCHGAGVIHLQPSKGAASDLQCGGSSELHTAPGGTMITASTSATGSSGATAMTLDWKLRLVTGG